MNDAPVPVVLPTRIADLEFNTVMDTGFFGAFAMTPEIHSHPYFELLAALCGEFRIELLDGTSVNLVAGTLCIIPPGFYHGTCAISKNPEKLAVRFSYRQLKDSDGMESVFSNFDKTLSSVKTPVSLISPLLCGIMENIRGELMDMEIAADVLVRSLIQQLYINLIRLLGLQNPLFTVTKTNLSEPDNNNSRYYRSEIYFSENYNRQITEEDMARELGLSKRQLSRVLRQIYNMSFREKLIDTRLHHAAKLLTRTDIPIEKIGYMIGYNTPSGFYTAFKKRFGVSGGEYRREFKSKLI